MLKGEGLKAVNEFELNPVLRACEPCGAFSGQCPVIIYNMGERGLVYYDKVPTKEIMSIKTMASSQLPHII